MRGNTCGRQEGRSVAISPGRIVKMKKHRLAILMATALIGLSTGMAGVASAHPKQVRRQPAPDVRISMDGHHYMMGDPIRFSVTVDRPAYVSVFRVDSWGNVSRVTRDRRGVRVNPGHAFRMPGHHARHSIVAVGEGEFELVAVASSRPFRSSDVPFLNCRLNSRTNLWTEGGGEYRHGFDAVISRMRRRTVLDQDRASYTVGHHRNRVRIAPWISVPRFRAHIDFSIGSNARVYIDGAFLGLGLAALQVQKAGWHRVTVHETNGHKFTRRVNFTADPRHSSRTRYWGQVEADSGRYSKKNR